MKAIFTVFGVLLLGLGELFGQTHVRLNIVLNHVQNLTIHPDQSSVTLTYNDLEDYRKGVEVVKNSHITVFSTGAYEVNVRLANEEFVKLGGQATNKLSMPNIKVNAMPVLANGQVILSTGVLTTIGGRIISSVVPSLNAAYDVTYHGPGGESLIRYAERIKNVIFSNDVLYSIETK